MNIILRRSKLGRTSARAIAQFAEQDFTVVRNWKHREYDPDRRVDVAFRWGCTSNINARSVVNTAEVIHLISDKPGTRKRLAEKDVPIPRTWYSRDDWMLDGLLEREYIVRPNTHHQGRNLLKFTRGGPDALMPFVRRFPNHYISEFINKDREYRVFVANGRCIAVAEKTVVDPNQAAWNRAQGGSFHNIRWDNWPMKAVRIGIEAAKAIGADFCGVDIIQKDNDVYVLELNSAPSLTDEYRQKCMAKAFDYIVEHGKETIPLIDAKGGWKKFIHPAISTEALL